MLTSLRGAVICLLYGSLFGSDPQEARGSGEPDTSQREQPLKWLLLSWSLSPTWLPIKCHVECIS